MIHKMQQMKHIYAWFRSSPTEFGVKKTETKEIKGINRPGDQN